jgi:alkylation response protein AidB-like acyl-CoA dehydrogenase
MAEAALDEAVLYAKKRLQFGKRIFEHQLIKKKLGDSKTAIAAGKALSVESFRTEFNGTGEAVNNAAMAKYFNSNVVERVTNDCLTAVGAISLTEELELSRYSREAKGFQFIEGTSEVLVQLIANGALMGYPKLWKQKDVE